MLKKEEEKKQREEAKRLREEAKLAKRSNKVNNRYAEHHLNETYICKGEAILEEVIVPQHQQ